MPRKQASLGNSSPLGAVTRARKSVKRLRKTASDQEPAVAVDALAELHPHTEQTLPSREGIALLAYSYWEARGCQGGCPEEDWLRAERELMGQSQRS